MSRKKTPKRESPDGFPYRIVVRWSPDDEAYVARVPALGLCTGDGPTHEAAVRQAREAAQGILDVLHADGKPTPAPDLESEYSGQLRLRIPRSLHRDLAEQAEDEGVSLNQLMVAALAAASGRRGEKAVGGGNGGPKKGR